ncbi:hypothetical protein [Acinetobacter rudis]|uniref:DUF2798 domain-containing protein n=1 Tax=Acinetobacter rudis TaxID=632955 RepID=A0AAW8JAA7_9GAMM|nr:hypothetical protein [Acinetobacter rudis]MDQ8935853.1 hypothetical protein [Acinetobacter rudis]MDQ8954465.1 hypothetical protein [Acinetobacter rudis]MDQ9018109.1 hypothetical protein [Acinetobacter rudis]
MPKSFAIRFAAVLLAVLVIFTIAIELSTSGETTVIMWIFAVPFILAIPILTSVILAKNDEMEIPTK